MPRARNIKPGFFESEDPAKVGYPQRLLWIALWTLADREGRLECRPTTFKKYAFGFDIVSVEEVAKWVEDLHDAGLIILYPVGATRVIQVENFHKHQRPHYKDPASEFPAPPSKINDRAKSQDLPLSSVNDRPIPQDLPLSLTYDRPFSRGNTPMIGGSPGMNVECRMLNVEGGRGKGALTPAPPLPQQLTINDNGPDPDELFHSAAKFACEHLPAGGDVHQTASAMRTEFQKSASFEGNPAGFCLAYTASVRKWRSAYDANPDLRTKQAQWWTRDGVYSQAPPAPRAPRRFGPVDLKAGLEVDDAL